MAEAETVGSSFCRGFSVSENHKSAPKKWDWVPLFCRENLLLDLWQVPDSVEVRQNHFFGQPKCLQGCARTGS